MSGATHAIPTTWNGIQFRSRLEARWASFFTKLGWEWSYEPIDLKGYIPDFFIGLGDERKILVEVKPVLNVEDAVVDEAIDKVRASGWEGMAIVAGATVSESRFGYGTLRIGAFVDDGASDFRDECAACACPEGNHVAICPVDGVWYCRMCGCGHKVYGGASASHLEWMLSSWNEAGNEVQWLGRGRRS